MTDALPDWLRRRIDDPALTAWTADVLVDLCEVDTTLGDDVERLRAAEAETFERFAAHVRPYLPEDAEVRRLPVDAAVEDDPYYTIPYYAGALADDPGAVYEARHNLYAARHAAGPGRAWVLNAHVDTVPPHVPPRRVDPHHIAGRGTTDDKGGVVLAALTARLLHEAHAAGLADRLPDVRYLLSIDEEMGGNGSVAAERGLDLRDATVVVLEPTRLRPHPANRGALWFAVDVRAEAGREALTLSFVADAALALADVGRALRRESRHPLFVPEDVQTCFGILGPYGEHPSSACAVVDLHLPERAGADASAVARAVEAALAAAEEAGRITRSAAPPDVTAAADGYRVRLHARDGHMGSRERDSDAVLKAAEVAAAFAARGIDARLPDLSAALTFEGGQGFVPTHDLDDVRDRMTAAFEAARDRFRARHGGGVDGTITFDKLHNAAYCSADDAVGAPTLAAAHADLLGGAPPPIAGWQVSCDARIFARSSSDVVTFGAGALEHAHQMDEAVDVREIVKGAGVLALALLREVTP